MKEDIFERLHYHSGLVAQGCWSDLDEYDREAIRRFGDLIVKECTDIIARRCVGDHNREEAEVMRCVADLRQHFGVEK